METVVATGLCEKHKRSKMTEDRGKNEIKDVKRESEKTRGDAEPPQTAEESEKRKLANCSGSLRPDSAGVSLNQTDLRGAPVGDDTREPPTVFNLLVQR